MNTEEVLQRPSSTQLRCARCSETMELTSKPVDEGGTLVQRHRVREEHGGLLRRRVGHEQSLPALCKDIHGAEAFTLEELLLHVHPIQQLERSSHGGHRALRDLYARLDLFHE